MATASRPRDNIFARAQSHALYIAMTARDPMIALRDAFVAGASDILPRLEARVAERQKICGSFAQAFAEVVQDLRREITDAESIGLFEAVHDDTEAGRPV